VTYFPTEGFNFLHGMNNWKWGSILE